MTIQQITSIIVNKDLEYEFIEFLQDNAQSTVADCFELYYSNLESDAYDDDCRVFALMEHTGDDFDDCDKRIYRDEYYVLTDDEADAKWDDYLEDYIDDIIIPELPESAQQYFDRDSWKSDCRAESDRGSALSSYDGNEHEQTINGVDYYIYKQ